MTTSLQVNPVAKTSLLTQLLPNVAALRAATSSTLKTTRVETVGYYTTALNVAPDGGGGVYIRNDADTTTADNGGSVIVDASGRRWYLLIFSSLNIAQFGAAASAADNSAAIAAALVAGAGIEVIFPAGTFKALTGNIRIYAGTTVSFRGNAAVDYRGTGACFIIRSSKNIVLSRPNILLQNADSAAIGLDVQGGWFIKIDQPIITGMSAANTQVGLNFVTSETTNLGFGCYMVQIFNPYFNAMEYGLKTAQQTSDTVKNTHFSIYDGWGNGTQYPLYLRGLSTFNIFGFTPENCIDGVNVDGCVSGFFHLGEVDASGYGINFLSTSNNSMSVVATSQAGNNISINTTFIAPHILSTNQIRLLGTSAGATQNYFYSLVASFNYGQSLIEQVAGGGSTRTMRTYDDTNWQRLYYVKSISGSGTVGFNLRGTATFAAATSVAVTFGTAEPDASYTITLSGNAAGYCWVTGKSTTGFTINCSASNSNAVDWHLIR